MQYYKLTLRRKGWWLFEGREYGRWLFRDRDSKDAVRRLKHTIRRRGRAYRQAWPSYLSDTLGEIDRALHKGHLERITAQECWSDYYDDEYEKWSRDVIYD